MSPWKNCAGASPQLRPTSVLSNSSDKTREKRSDHRHKTRKKRKHAGRPVFPKQVIGHPLPHSPSSPSPSEHGNKTRNQRKHAGRTAPFPAGSGRWTVAERNDEKRVFGGAGGGGGALVHYTTIIIIKENPQKNIGNYLGFYTMVFGPKRSP